MPDIAMTNEAFAEMIADFAREHDVEPDADFIADAGRDYGYVAAWSLPDGRYALAYGDNGQTDYYVADDADDLGQWLIHDNLDSPESVIEVANVRGIAALGEASQDNLGRGYGIMVSRDFYGPTTSHDLARDERGDVIEYATLAEAQEAAEEMDGGDYVTAHNEIGRPTYTVVDL